MKKILSVFIALSLMLAAVPAGVIGAADTIDVVVDTTVASPADAGVELYVRLGAEPHWASLGLEFTFDPDVLVFKGFRRNPAIDAQAAAGETMMYTLNVESAENGNVGVYYTTAGSSGGYFGYFPDGYDYFGVLTFDVKPTAPEGLSAVSVAVTSLTDFFSDPVPFTVTAGGVSVTACEHDWQLTAHVDEDCENAGYSDYVCAKCGATRHESFPARGHYWNEIGRVEPTATTEGSVTSECVWCGAVRTEIIPVLPPFSGVRIRLEKVVAGNNKADMRLFVDDVPHWSAVSLQFNFDPAVFSFKAFAQNPILLEQTENGASNVFMINKENAASGEVLVLFASTCDDDGYEGFHSEGTGYLGTFRVNVAAGAPVGFHEITVTVEDLVDSTGAPVDFEAVAGGAQVVCSHDWQEIERSETSCEADGYVVYECSNCGELKRETLGQAFGHDWGEWEVTTPATCVSEGVETRVCANDASHVETRAVPVDPEAHEWVEIGVADPTCSAEGAVYYACLYDAGHTKEETVPIDPDAHAWGEWEITAPATCAGGATETRVCSRDASHIETRVIGEPDPEAHAWGEWEVTAPATCAAEGVETRVCANDSSHFEERAIPVDPDAHSWGDWEVTTPATCAAEGVERRVCANDASHFEERAIDIDPDAHVWGEWTLTAAPTCTEPGEETRVCANDASHVETRAVPVDPDAHEWVEVGVADPTCSAAGAVHYACLYDAGHTKDEIIPIDPDAHAWGEWEITAPATCAAEGVETRVCANDSSHFEERAIPVDADAHSWGDWTLTTAPTCAEPGEETRVCANDASHVETREVPIDPDAHEWGDWEVTTPATCVAEGVETRFCEYNKEHFETRAVPVDPEAHAWSQVGSMDATCTERGWVEYVCDHDNTHTKREYTQINPEAHDWGEWEVTRPQTYYEVGEETRRCLNDETHVETRDIPKYLKGDFDFDGRITVADALAALRISTKLVEQTDVSLAIGDIDRDDRITVADALQILRVSTRLISMEEWLA